MLYLWSFYACRNSASRSSAIMSAKCVCASFKVMLTWTGEGGGAGSSSTASAIVSSASLPSGELVGNPTCIRLAQPAYRPTAMLDRSFF